MRGILFKGKRVDNDKWVEGWIYWLSKGAYLNPIQNGCYIQTFQKLDNGEIILTGIYEVDVDTVGQYTGLTDKNGVKIFENDIVKVNGNRIGYIKFLQQEMGYCVVYSNFDTRLGHRNTGGCYDNNNFIEVIGNIFDTPELLK